MESQVNRSNDDLFIYSEIKSKRMRQWNDIQITLTTDYKLVWNLDDLFPNRERQTEKGWNILLHTLFEEMAWMDLSPIVQYDFRTTTFCNKFVSIKSQLKYKRFWSFHFPILIDIFEKKICFIITFSLRKSVRSQKKKSISKMCQNDSVGKVKVAFFQRRISCCQDYRHTPTYFSTFLLWSFLLFLKVCYTHSPL